MFSIYQHLQYVPVIFVSAFLVAFCSLWSASKYKKTLWILAPLLGVYAIASMSMLAIALLLTGLLGYAIYQWKHFLDKAAILLFLVVMLSAAAYLQIGKDVMKFKFTFLNTASLNTASLNTANQSQIAPNIKERLYYWEYYVKNIVTSPQTLLIGHAEPPNRKQYPSAHNYYLDIIYNFGFIALFPMLIMLVYTLMLVYRFRRDVYSSTSLLSLSAVVLFLIIIDNALKVGLRQPYSGIFIFFLWGVLISKLSEVRLQKFNKFRTDPAIEQKAG